VTLLRGAARVLLLGRHEQRLDIARAYGADAVAAHTDDAARAAVRAWSPDGADVVIECVGTAQTWRLASELAAPGGRVLLFGGCAAGTDVSFDAYRVHYEEVDLIGAFHYTPRAVVEAHALLCSGAVDGAPLITDSRPLDGLADALALIGRRAAVKVAVRP
jgi:L-iditol 2-dehydrogenase